MSTRTLGVYNFVRKELTTWKLEVLVSFFVLIFFYLLTFILFLIFNKSFSIFFLLPLILIFVLVFNYFHFINFRVIYSRFIRFHFFFYFIFYISFFLNLRLHCIIKYNVTQYNVTQAIDVHEQWDVWVLPRPDRLR